MKGLRQVALGAWLLLACGGVGGANTAEAPWTLEHCIQTAQQQHGSALAAGEEARAAEAELRKAGSSLFYPVVSAYSTHLRGGIEADQAGSVPRNTGTITDEQYLMTAEVTLYDGGVQKRNVRMARAVRDATLANLRRETQALELRVIESYVQVLRARHAIRVAQQKLESAQAQIEMVLARRDAGTAAGVDVYPIEVQIANARVEKLGAEAELRASGSALRNAMGLEEGPVPEVAELPETPAEPASLDACIDLARASRPEVIAAQADLERERAVVALARLKSRPQLETAARVDRGLGGSTIHSQWLVYATLTWSLFDRSQREESAAGEARIAALEARYRQLLKDIASEVTQAYIALQGARARAEASEVSVAMARKSLEVAEARYQLGLAIPIELVDAQIARSTAELQAIQLRYDAFLAHARLRHAMGQESLIP